MAKAQKKAKTRARAMGPKTTMETVGQRAETLHMMARILTNAKQAATEDTRAGAMSAFSSGATRSQASDRIDPRGFISPKAMLAYCEYMKKNQLQADGRRRASDNWKKGMPVPRYIESFFRHSLQLHDAWEAFLYVDPGSEAAWEAHQLVKEHACAIMFNMMGLLHEDGLKTDLRASEHGRRPDPYA